MAKKVKSTSLGATTPTQDQIDRVKTNLRNLIQLNSDLLVGGNLKIENAFALLTIQDNRDLGTQIGINLIDGAFWAASAMTDGAIADPLAAAAANFCCGVISNYSSNTPPSLQGATSQLITRFQNTSNQFQRDLETFEQDPVTYWNVQYGGTVCTPFGTHNVSGSLADLSTVDVPGKLDPSYTDIEVRCEYGLDQEVWNVLLPNFVITAWYPEMKFPANQYNDQGMVNWNNDYYANNPSYHNVWKYYYDKGFFGGDKSAYYLTQYNIGTGYSVFSDGHLSSQACNYLFSDLTDGVPNPNAVNGGLYTRSFVFNNMPNIKKTSHTFSN